MTNAVPSLPPGAPEDIIPAHYDWWINAGHGLLYLEAGEYKRGSGWYAEHVSALDEVLAMSEAHTLEIAPTHPSYWNYPIALYRTGEFKPSAGSGAFDARWAADLKKPNGDVYHDSDWGWWNTYVYSSRECPRGRSIWNYAVDGNLVERFCKRNSHYFTIEENVGKPQQCPVGSAGAQPFAGNPVNIGTGNKYQKVRLFEHATSPLKFEYHYNSQLKHNFWTHTYSARVSGYLKQMLADPIRAQDISHTNQISLKVRRPDGRVIRFRNVITDWTTLTTEETYWHDLSNSGYSLEGRYGSAGKLARYKLRTPEGNVETYDIGGQLTKIQYLSGQFVTLSYISGELDTVKDAFGNEVSFASDGDDLAVTDPAGNTYKIKFSAPHVNLGDNREHQRIEAIYFPDTTPGDDSDNPREIFLYKEPNSRLLTGIVDERGNQYATWVYVQDGDGIWKVTSSKHALDTEVYTLAYNGSTTTVTDPLGNSSEYKFVIERGQKKMTEVIGDGCTSCGSKNMAVAYDANGYISSKTDKNGNTTSYIRDEEGREISRTEAEGSAEERTITTVWDSTHTRKPQQVTEPGRETSYTYNTAGQVLTRSVEDTATGEIRTTTYTYTAEGKISTIDGPRTDVSDITTFTYDAAGNRATQTNALGQVTQYTDYDGMGRLLKMVDPNGLETTFTYTPRGWLASQTVDDGNNLAVTAYGYDAAGNLVSLTPPAGGTLTFRYDAANRLDRIDDTLGNRVVYVLDVMGNITKEKVRDSGGTLQRVQEWIYDDLNRLEKHLGALDQETLYTHDDNGNQTSVTDALSRLTTQTFDALDRIKTRIDPASGVTSYGYDALGRVTSVIDPRGNTTNYSYNAFGDKLSQASPDSGTTTYQYDKAGNQIQMTDARGVVSTYNYDAINRRTAINYPGSSTENVSFSYDNIQGGHPGIGRLTGMTDEAGTTTYRYDLRSNIIEETITVSGISYTTDKVYDAAGRVIEMTYPQGRIVYYEYDVYDRITRIRTRRKAGAVRKVVVENLQYDAAGQLVSMTHGNGIVTTYSYDQDGRVTQISASDGTTVRDAVYQYDAASQIDAIDFADNNLDRDYNYDALSRITYDDGPTASDTLSYDLVGNRTSLNAVNFVYESSSNRLIERNGKPFVHDASGNMLETNNGKRVYTYNHAGRIETYTYQGELRGTYRYDGHGRRRVVDTSIPIRYFYGDGSQYISQVEMDSDTPTIIDKTYDVIWMGDMPVAHYTIEYYPGGSVKKRSTEFLHTDHLATPRLATDDTGTAVWRWEGDAFGQDEPDQDVDGDGENIVINLRFPGQIKTHWAETYYNYFRTYDPSTGRYLESDPIGLEGGLNTYAYVGGNPLRYTDPLGLHHDGLGCVDPRGNRVPCPRNVCANANCGAGLPPVPEPDPCSKCRAGCVFDFLNPIPGIGIEKGAGAAGRRFGDVAGELATDAAKKVNKAKGAYDLGQCLDRCKKVCDDDNCSSP